MDATTICNLALGRIGEARIMSIDEDTAPARACKRFYEPVRDEVLREHRWNFARRRRALSKLAEAPPFGFFYQYQLPEDFLRLVELNEEDVDIHSAELDPYEIEGRAVLTDADTCNIVYIARTIDANLYDSHFVKAFSLKLAAELATIISQHREYAAALMQEYGSFVLPSAKRVDANENRSRRRLQWQDSDVVRARGGWTVSSRGGKLVPAAPVITVDPSGNYYTVSNDPEGKIPRIVP